MRPQVRTAAATGAFNAGLIAALQESGIAAPSATAIGGSW
jgi:hypothetical protein